MKDILMNELEITMDKLLNIRTGGRDDSQADTCRYPYEPTPYPVLERLAAEQYIGKSNLLIDYGAGKGRVSFYLSYQTKCRSLGVEYSERIYLRALENKETAVSGRRVSLICQSAESFKVPAEADRFFFFNPFSWELLQAVLCRIRESYYESPRELLLFFYYPSDEYFSLLMNDELFTFYDETDCRDLFDGKDPRERIMIFGVS